MGAGGRREVADGGELEVALEGDADERTAGPPAPDLLDRLSAIHLTRLSRPAGVVAAVLAVLVGVGLGLRHAVDHRAADRLAAALAAANRLDADAQSIQHTMAAEGTATDGPLLDATVAALDDQEAERLVSLSQQANAATVVDDARLDRLRADATAYLAAWANNLRAVARFARAHPEAFASPPYGPVGSPTLGPTLGPPPNVTIPDPPAPQTGPTVRLGATTATLADTVAAAWGIPTAAIGALGPAARRDVTLTAADHALGLLARPLDTPSADIVVVAGGGSAGGGGGLAFVPLAGTAARSASLPVTADVTAPSPSRSAARAAGVRSSTATTASAASAAVGGTGSAASVGSSAPGGVTIAEVLRAGSWLALGVPASDGGLDVLSVPVPSAAAVARLARGGRAGQPPALGDVTTVASFAASETESPTERVGGVLTQPASIAPGPRPGSIWVVGTSRAEALARGGRAVLPAAILPEHHLVATFTGLAAAGELLVWNDEIASAPNFAGQLARVDPATGRVVPIPASVQTTVFGGQVTETSCGLPLAASATTFFWASSLDCAESPSSLRLEETNASTGATATLNLVSGGAAGTTSGLPAGVQLTTDFGAVSPNGELLAVALQGSAHAWNGTPVWTLGIVNVATGRIQVVPGATVAPVPAQPFAWAPDGRRLFFQTDDVNAGLATWRVGSASAVDIRGTASLAPPRSQPTAPVGSEADLYAAGSARQGELVALGPGD